MKGLVVYDTSYGNTQKFGESIADTLKESGVEVDLFHVKDVKRISASDYDFLVVGSLTRINTMSFAVRGFIGKIKGEEWRNKPFSSFDTELQSVIEKGGKGRWSGSAAEKIAKKLSEKGLKQILPVLKTAVLDTKGPLKEGEIENTEKYARELASKLKGK